MWQEALRIFSSHHTFLLTTHQYPDGDGIGAAVALMDLLKSLKKKVKFVCDSPIPDKYSFLIDSESFSTYDPENELDFEVIILLDTHRIDRIGRLSKILENDSVTSLCIDHHPPTEVITEYAVIDQEACSVGALIYDLFQTLSSPLTFTAAQGIYVSVLCDTVRFSHVCQDRIAYKVADACVKCGVNPDLIYSSLYQHVPLDHVKMLSGILQRMELYLDNKVVIQHICKEDFDRLGLDWSQIDMLDLDYLIEFPSQIDEVECVVILREQSEHRIRISLRSKGKIDVSELMRSIGGGGHNRAAGSIYEGSLLDAKSKVLELLEPLFQAPREMMSNVRS